MSRKPPRSDSGDSGSYEVGYCKPPSRTQFKPGHSGNPRGRPKGTRNLKTDLAEELAERIPINEGGRKRAISKQRAMLKQLMAKALRGDVRAANSIIGLVERLIDIHVDDARAPITAQDQAIVSDYLRRHGATVKAFAEADDPTSAEGDAK